MAISKLNRSCNQWLWFLSSKGIGSVFGKYLRLEDGLSSVHEGGDDGGGVDSHVPWAELKRCEAAFL